MQERPQLMYSKTENTLMKIPVVKQILWLTKQIKLPGLEGLTFYDFIKLYLRGILQGTF